MSDSDVERKVSRWFTWGVFILLSLIWGTSFILIKKGLEAYTPFQVVSLRVITAFIVLLFLIIPSLKKIPFRYWPYFLLVGLCGSLIPGTVFGIAQTRVDSSIAAMLNSMTPIFTFLLAWLGFRYKVHRKQVIGVFVGFIGSLNFAFVQTGDLKFEPFALIVLIACTSYAISTMISKHYLKSVSPLFIALASISMITPIALTYLLTTDFLDIARTPVGLRSLGYLSILGALSTGAAFILYQSLLKKVGPVFAAMVTYVIPLVALGWGVLDGEQLSSLHILGMTLILTGVYLTKQN